MDEVRDIIGITTPTDEATKRRALRTVAHYSTNAEECLEFAMALGLIGADE